MQENSRSARLTANQPPRKIFPGDRNILRLWRPVSDKIMRPLFCYWYTKSQSEKYVHSKP